jgi:hypothetical protein
MWTVIRSGPQGSGTQEPAASSQRDSDRTSRKRLNRVATSSAITRRGAYRPSSQTRRPRIDIPDRQFGALSAAAFSVGLPTPIIQLCAERAEAIRLRE